MHLLEGGFDIRTVQEFLGHNDVENNGIRAEMIPDSQAFYTALNAVLRVLYGYI